VSHLSHSLPDREASNAIWPPSPNGPYGVSLHTVQNCEGGTGNAKARPYGRAFALYARSLFRERGIELREGGIELLVEGIWILCSEIFLDSLRFR